MAHTYALGKSGVSVTPIGLGCWQFSRSKGLAGRYWPSIPQETVREIVKVTLDGGINWFDTAEVYGNGASEQSLAEALRSLGVEHDRYVLADKWFPAFRFAGSIQKTFPDRLRALDGISIDLHQIHQPFSFSSVEQQVARMGELVRQGRIRAVGVSNFNVERMRKAYARLTVEGLPLASNQMRYSLIDREIERNGLLDTARELGISIIAYSPLAQGLLTGKFHAPPAGSESGGTASTPSAPRKWMKRFKPEGLAASEPLIRELQKVAEAHAATPSQAALAWVIQRHGELVVAIPGASSVSQARSNADALKVSLTPEELDLLADAGLEAERRLKSK
jgi:aryl-alcohol dehydrogenase-like predicted oxidoreductase